MGTKGKTKSDEKEEKRRADIARKAEKARLLAEEEAALLAKPKPSPTKAGKKPFGESKPAGPGAIAAGGGLESPKDKEAEPVAVESFAASGIDNALDLLEVVTAKMDKASVGQQAAAIERHPEVRPCLDPFTIVRLTLLVVAAVQGVYRSQSLRTCSQIISFLGSS